MLLKAIIQSCSEKKNNTFSTQWFLEVMVNELQKWQYNCEDADLWNCYWKSQKNMLTTRAVVFEGLRMRRTKQFIDECLKTTSLDKGLLKCYLIKLNCVRGLIKNIKKIKTRSVRLVSLIGQVKSFSFL